MKQWIIATCVAVVYLIVSIAFGAWQWTWILWFGYGIYRMLDNRKNDKENV